MISMLIVQDLAFVPIMLVLTELNQPDGGVSALIGAIVRAGIFLVVMVVVGTRLMPAILHRISQWGSRELFLVAITALGLGVGYATYLAGLSFAFGAFVAGMVLSESEYSHQALSDIVPLRDIFSMIFFVSVGMLLDPRYVWQYGAVIAGLVVVIMLLKAAVFVAITRLFGYRDGIPVAVGIGLLQVGEFAFVLSRVARSQQVIDADQDFPPFDRVMMDGIAVRFSDVQGGCRDFEISGSAPAGASRQTLVRGALEVMTGAVLPEGCDCVVPVEWYEIQNGRAVLNETATPKQGVFIHRQGSD
ncbi:MAG: cation:proton antiporter, partial [Roseiflexaceae bacterium]